MMKGSKQLWRWSLFCGVFVLVALAWLAVASAREARIVYVFSENCGYCTTFTPTFEQVTKDYPQHLVERLDIHNEQELNEAIRLGAQATPTVFIVEGGRVKDKLEGAVPEELLQSFLQRNLTQPLSKNG